MHELHRTIQGVQDANLRAVQAVKQLVRNMNSIQNSYQCTAICCVYQIQVFFLYIQKLPTLIEVFAKGLPAKPKAIWNCSNYQSFCQHSGC